MSNNAFLGVRDGLALWLLSLLAVSLAGMVPVSDRLLRSVMPQLALASLAALLFASRKSAREVLRLPRRSDAAPLLFLSVAAVAMAQTAGYLAWAVAPPPASYREQLRLLFPETSDELLARLAMTWILVAPAEEAVFRGHIFTSIRRGMRTSHAVMLSGLLFAISHLDPWRFTSSLIVGVLAAAALLKTGSLLSSIIVHSSNNSVALLLSLTLRLPA